MQNISVWNRPEAKKVDAGAQQPLTEAQKAFRVTFAETITNLIQDHLNDAGGFLTPGNNEEKGTLMVALSLPMPAIACTVDGEAVTTRPWNLNINATLPSIKQEKAEKPVIQTTALTFAELRAAQLAKRKK